MLDSRTRDLLQRRKPKEIRSDTVALAWEIVKEGEKMIGAIDDRRFAIDEPGREAALHVLATRIREAQRQFMILWNTKQRSGE